MIPKRWDKNLVQEILPEGRIIDRILLIEGYLHISTFYSGLYSFIIFLFLFLFSFPFLLYIYINVILQGWGRQKKEQKNTSQSEIHMTSHFPPTSTSQNNAPLMWINFTNLWNSSTMYFIQIGEELMKIECMRRIVSYNVLLVKFILYLQCNIISMCTKYIFLKFSSPCGQM